MGSLRPLLPKEGSSVRIEDHLIGVYDKGALRGMREIDTTLLEGYIRGPTPSGAPPGAANVSLFPLPPHESSLLSIINLIDSLIT
jgi:hypothetical protein